MQAIQPNQVKRETVIGVRLSRAERQRIERLAAHTNSKPGTWVRRVLLEYLAAEGGEGDKAQIKA